MAHNRLWHSDVIRSDLHALAPTTGLHLNNALSANPEKMLNP